MTREDATDADLIDETVDDDFSDDDLDDDVSDADDTDDGDTEEPPTEWSDVPTPAGRSGAPTVGLQTLPVTGEPRVDDALARLTDLSSLPVDEHVGVFEDVQRRLHDTLADLSGQ